MIALLYKIHYTSRTATHPRHLPTQHRTIQEMQRRGVNRSQQDKQEEVRGGVSPRWQRWHATRSLPTRCDTPAVWHSAAGDCFPSGVWGRAQSSLVLEKHPIKNSQYNVDPEGEWTPVQKVHRSEKDLRVCWGTECLTGFHSFSTKKPLFSSSLAAISSSTAYGAIQ